jgi:hypothetical protein
MIKPYLPPGPGPSFPKRDGFLPYKSQILTLLQLLISNYYTSLITATGGQFQQLHYY